MGAVGGAPVGSAWVSVIVMRQRGGGGARGASPPRQDGVGRAGTQKPGSITRGFKVLVSAIAVLGTWLSRFEGAISDTNDLT